MSEIVIIAAVARNGAIGRGNELLFREPADQRRFRASTMGHPVLMGRRTWQSLSPKFRPLPGRRNLVLSRDASFEAPGAEVAGGLDDALARTAGAPRVFVIGGAELYAQALPRAAELLLTEVDADLDGDTFFPPWDRAAFAEAAREHHRSGTGIGYDFVTWRRR